MYVQLLQVGEVTKRCWNTAAQLIVGQVPVNNKHSAMCDQRPTKHRSCILRAPTTSTEFHIM